ncbi:MAG: hypothetical protein ACFFEV_01150 [Candidatus Thorarchaeota archaeon]
MKEEDLSNQEEKKKPEESKIYRKVLSDSRFWIAILSVLLVALNFTMFTVYQSLNPGESIWGQLWGYIESDTFKIITISIFLPIITFFLDIIFGIRKAVLERKQKEIDTQRERRWQCVELTSKNWNELYDLCSQVRYFKKKEPEGIRIEDILIKLDTYSCRTEDIVNMWHFRFTNLSFNDTELFIEILNYLLESTTIVAQSIKDDGDPKEIAELQYTLEIIQKRLNRIGHHHIIGILKKSIDVCDESKSEEEKESQRKEIAKLLEDLRYWQRLLRNEELWIAYHLSTIDNEDLQNFASKIEAWKQNNPKPDGVFHFPELIDFRKEYLGVPPEELHSSWIAYRWSYYKRLSNEFRFWNECDSLTASINLKKNNS